MRRVSMQDEITHMAREAELERFWLRKGGIDLYEAVERFAALVAEATKEKAAKMLESHCETNHGLMSDEGYRMAVHHCAEAIRSMKCL